MKIVISKNAGGYYIPRSVALELGEENCLLMARNDNRLIDELEKCGVPPDLAIVDIPDDVEWQIDSCENGYEWIAEKHRTWS